MNFRMTRPTLVSGLLFAGLLFMSVQVVEATTLRSLQLDEMVSLSDEIVVGKCEKTESVWLGKKIYTVATIRVSETAKGTNTAGQIVTVYNLGGRVTTPLPMEMYVEGAAQMREGEEMFLFLEKYGEKKQFHRTVGMAQGKVPVSTDATTGDRVVQYGQPIKGVKWVDAKGKSVAANVQGAKEEPADARTLDGFLGRIKKIKTEQDAKDKAQSDAEHGAGGAK